MMTDGGYKRIWAEEAAAVISRHSSGISVEIHEKTWTG